MHPAAFNYVRSVAEKLPARKQVLEYGGRDINGTVKHCFDGASYLSIDIVDGAGVDVVADASEYQPKVTPDTIICCEVLEHTNKWALIVMNAAKTLDENGILILTCATTGRAPHSAVDGMQVRDGEYYGNVEVSEMMAVLSQNFSEYDLDVDSGAGDLYVTAFKGLRPN